MIASPGAGLKCHRVPGCGQGIRSHDHVWIVGPASAGKTYLAWALAQMACWLGYSALYFRLPRFSLELAVAKGDGR